MSRNQPRTGAVAGGHPLTVEAAEHVLRAGGNAYDAAVAGLAAQWVAEPVLASPGGGGFMLAAPAGQRPKVLDFFVHTPGRRVPEPDLDFYAITADFGPATQEFHIGRGTVATPGMVRGLFRIHRELGTMPMRDLLAPAIAWARDGIVVSEFQGYLFEVVNATFTATDASRAIYGSHREPGATVRAGETLRQTDLADTLEVLAIEGERLFYEGEIAALIERDLADGGHLTREDLRQYDVVLREPLERDHGGARILTNPPPSSGGLLIAFGLALLADAGDGHPPHGAPAHVARMIEVQACTVRARVEAAAREADAGAGGRFDMLDPAYLALYRERVLGRAAAHRGTTHLSIIDGDGNLASVTVSNGEGSGYIVPGAGIVMNNMLGEEDLNPGGFHRWPLAHRMTSMMAPSAVLWADGRRLAVGSGGSNRIRTAVLQVLHNLVDLGMHVEEAVEAARLHVEGEHVAIEGGFDLERIAGVLDGFPDHRRWPGRNLFFGGAHAASRDARGFEAWGDSRRAGVSRVIG